MVRLCEGFISPEETLEKVIYFTASPLNSAKNARQGAFLNANKSINEKRFEIIRGKYLDKHITCPSCGYDISRPEEKKTDVNICMRMVQDCIHNATDVAVLVSADSDLIPPLELIRTEFPKKKIRVCFPPSNYSHDIANTLAAWGLKAVIMKKNFKRFENAVMPDSVGFGENKNTIPPEWKAKQTKKSSPDFASRTER